MCVFCAQPVFVLCVVLMPQICVLAKIGPNGLDREIWTKSGPNLDTIWTGFLKMGAKIPGKILCPRTRELILASALSEKFKIFLYRDCVRTREGGT